MRRSALSTAVLFAAFCALVAVAGSASWSSQTAPAPQLGQVSFSTSCTAEAQPLIETAVALQHSFQYQQADQIFSEAAKRDPKCAMAYWGKAMTRYEQLWEFPSGKALKRGAEDIQRAQSLGAPTARRFI
jgi:tetratricopeptide (TPR) repeat protein